MSDEQERRKWAREDMTRLVYKQRLKQGEALPSYRECEKYVSERADICDKKKDWGVKE